MTGHLTLVSEENINHFIFKWKECLIVIIGRVLITYSLSSLRKSQSSLNGPHSFDKIIHVRNIIKCNNSCLLLLYLLFILSQDKLWVIVQKIKLFRKTFPVCLFSYRALFLTKSNTHRQQFKVVYLRTSQCVIRLFSL